MIMGTMLAMASCILLVSLISAQQKTRPCDSSIKYESRNQVDPPALSVSMVSGRVIDEVGELGESVKEIGPVAGACLGLFTEKEHQLKATTVADDEGRFTFEMVRSGKYRLVVHAGPLCVANVPLRVIRMKRGANAVQRQVVVHMRAAGYDSCSYAEYR
jgi:hypothetical protein